MCYCHNYTVAGAGVLADYCHSYTVSQISCPQAHTPKLHCLNTSLKAISLPSWMFACHNKWYNPWGLQIFIVSSREKLLTTHQKDERKGIDLITRKLEWETSFFFYMEISATFLFLICQFNDEWKDFCYILFYFLPISFFTCNQQLTPSNYIVFEKYIIFLTTCVTVY